MSLADKLEELNLKEKAIKQDYKGKIDVKDGIKTLKNEHVLKAIVRQGKRSELKIDKIKIRLKNVEGDALMMAASVVYML